MVTVPLLANLAAGGTGTAVPISVLLVGCGVESRRLASEVASAEHLKITEARDLSEAGRSLARHPADVVLLDVSLPDQSATTLLNEITSRYPRTDVVVLTGPSTVATAMQAMRSGASDYLTIPFTPEDLASVLDRARQRITRDVESRRLREQLRTPTGMGPLVGTSAGMEKLYRILSKVALSQHPVLIVGESGTGKGLVARTIHQVGLHAAQPFVRVDCSAVSPNEVEAELFGTGREASAGTTIQRDGALVSAGGGIVFLDEVGELPIEIQAKLVQAMLDKNVRPVGGSQRRPFAARIVASTGRDLIAAVEQGQFRKDLYFRLNVVKLAIPPLRERRDDIPMLAQHFLGTTQRERAASFRFSDACLRWLCNYDWPGNVSELQSTIERTCTMSSGPVLHTVDLPTQLQDFHAHLGVSSATSSLAYDEDRRRPIVPIADMEKKAILNTIRQLNGDKLMAARLLGIGKTTLYRKLKEYGENC